MKTKKSPAKFFLELGALKRMPRSGWVRAGIQNPENVASHSYRVALIAWVLAKIENVDSDKVVKMALLHDLEEARTGDLDMVMKRYLGNKREKAFRDILKNSNFEKEALDLLSEKNSLESKIVKDSDKIELFLQAHEYEAAGFKETEKWKTAARKCLKLKSSKKLVREIAKQNLTWWYP